MSWTVAALALLPLQAELSYQKATYINDKAAQAWQGLSQLYHDTRQWAKAAEADQVLVCESQSAAALHTGSESASSKHLRQHPS